MNYFLSRTGVIIFTDGGAELEKLYYEKAPVLWGDKITELLSANSIMKDVQQKITVLNSYNDRDIFKIMLSEGIAVEKIEKQKNCFK